MNKMSCKADGGSRDTQLKPETIPPNGTVIFLTHGHNRRLDLNKAFLCELLAKYAVTLLCCEDKLIKHKAGEYLLRDKEGLWKGAQKIK